MKNSFEEEVTLYLHYLAKPFIIIQEVFTTPKGIAFVIPTIGTISLLSTQKLAFLFLVIAFLLDFITGVIASFMERLKKEKKEQQVDFLNWKEKVVYFFDNISSDQMKRSIVKGIAYSVFILCSSGIQHIFKIKPFTFSFSELTWDLPLIAVAGAIVIELWSILLENFKRMGFDIIKIALEMFSKAKEVKNEVMNLKD
jgi:hypothetical protein